MEFSHEQICSNNGRRPTLAQEDEWSVEGLPGVPKRCIVLTAEERDDFEDDLNRAAEVGYHCVAAGYNQRQIVDGADRLVENRFWWAVMRL
jgi:hypothetical protein